MRAAFAGFHFCAFECFPAALVFVRLLLSVQMIYRKRPVFEMMHVPVETTSALACRGICGLAKKTREIGYFVIISKPLPQLLPLHCIAPLLSPKIYTTLFHHRMW